MIFSLLLLLYILTLISFFYTFQFSRSKGPFISTVRTANMYSSIPISNFFTARLIFPEDGSSFIPETWVTYPREQQYEYWTSWEFQISL